MARHADPSPQLFDFFDFFDMYAIWEFHIFDFFDFFEMYVSLGHPLFLLVQCVEAQP